MFAIALAIVSNQPEALGASLPANAAEEVGHAAGLIKEIETVDKALSQTAWAEEVPLDQTTLVKQTPKPPVGIDEGALYHPDIENLPFPGYETKEDLKHPAGDEHNLDLEEAKNFSGKPTPKILASGTKIYRIISPKNMPNGAYWAYTLPKGLKEWRNEYAVTRKWNTNGYYVEHIVEENGLPAWEGHVASQDLSKFGYKGWILPGGNVQIYIKDSINQIPHDLPLKSTSWRK